MSWQSPENTPSFVDTDGEVVLCPTPIEFALPTGFNTIFPGLSRSMSGDWPPQVCNRGPYINHSDALVPIYDFFSEGVGSSGGVRGVPPMGLQPLSYPWNNPAEYRVPDHGFRIPMAPATDGNILPMSNPISYASKIAMPQMILGVGFGIPPMASPTARGVPRGVLSSLPTIYSWSYALEYGVPIGSFGVPHFSYGIPGSDLGTHRTPLNNFGKQPTSVEQEMKQQEPKESKAAASDSAGKKKYAAKLLEGFDVIEEVRRGGKSIGHKDKYYIHMETGKKLRSLKRGRTFQVDRKREETKAISKWQHL